MKSKQLYTVIVDYNGGTYCAQVNATDEAHAVVEWVQQIAKDEMMVSQFTLQGIHSLQEQDWIEECRPLPLNDLVNIWCQSVLVKKELCLINVILTRAK